MENLTGITVFLFILINPSLQQLLGGFFPRFKPLCRNRTADVRFVEFNIKLSPLVEFDQNSGRIDLFMEASWEVDFSDEGLPGEIPLDGFAVHFMSLEEKRDPAIPNDSDLPTSSCFSGSDHVWVQTSDAEGCDDNATADYCKDRYPDFCLCRVGNCSLIPDVNCRGIVDLLQDSQDNYQTIPSSTRKLVFPVDFHVEYEFTITPYYRQYANGSPVTKIGKVIDCPSLFENTTFEEQEIREFCCSNGIDSVVAYNITVSEPRPVFVRRANATTVNVTITWLPPGDGEAVERFFTIIQDLSSYEMPTEGEIRKIPYDATPDDSNGTCKTPKYYYQVEVSDLVPGREYRIDITTVFFPSLQTFKCNGMQCRVQKKFFARVPEDLCEEEFNLCHPSATCENVFDPSTRRDATCTCGSGLQGDGLNVDLDLGMGCTELNECNNSSKECHGLAICTDLSAPDTGVKCHCPDGYYGDGREDGTGCRSSIETALAIALPIVAVVIIITAVVVWYVIRERRRRLDTILQKYIATDNGILSHLNQGADEEKGPWEPTFGHHWEIARNRLIFGKVLGRGNYGVVHLAWLSNNHVMDQENGNGAYRNGDFYDPVSSQETGKHHYDEIESNSTVVAVKCLQESTENRKNLVNFLEEIGFMLNVGEHDNIVGVYGCTTTEEPVYMITEYMVYGDLLHFLWDAREMSKGKIDTVYAVTERSLCKMATDVANAMEYLEQIRVIHGDIAARNILVGENGICKLSDFGLANDVYRYGWSKGDKEQLVPFKWISPERMMTGQVPITSKSDVWSFGNLLYEMFTLGCPPHPGVESSKLLHLLRTGYRMKKPKSCNDQMYDLMNKCWRWRPSSRPTFGQLLKLLNALTRYVASQGQVDMVDVVEELDREEYVNELESELQEKTKDYENGNITIVENECDQQSLAI